MLYEVITPATKKKATRRATTPRTPRKPTLDASALSQARATASAYDRTRMYSEGDWFLHLV